ncbi:hypothetical protein QTO34_012817 [Cnephaeus nilssonii]|uniref:C2H2-type domain-containing protein n=1 Tax=Cnephaeus nilssonii TaxID=3371016 RepID=A0AA40HB65_CNENI|nr:hypothetical protein QTO34_012817 [Eptesicus nilssonii]
MPGCWHKMDDVQAYSEHSVYIGDSQGTHLHKPCFSVLKDNLHLTELQVVYSEKNVFLSDACKDASGEKPWNEDMKSDSLVTRCCFYLSRVSAASTEVWEDSPAISGLLQYQAILNTEDPHGNNEISQEFLSGKRHHQWFECETAASQKHKVVYQKGLCSGDMIYEYNKCGKVFRQIFNHLQHGRVHTGDACTL